MVMQMAIDVANFALPKPTSAARHGFETAPEEDGAGRDRFYADAAGNGIVGERD
jgi:hypothetical protein